MAWTDPNGLDPDPGDVLTAAGVQTYLLDNLTHLQDNPRIAAALGTTAPANDVYGEPANYDSDVRMVGDDMTVGTTGITVGVAGAYLILSMLDCSFGATPSNTWHLLHTINKNGSAVREGHVNVANKANVHTTYTLVDFQVLAANDRISASGRQDSGTGGRGITSFLAVMRLGS